MSSSSPTNDPTLHPILEFALPGVTFLAGGFLLWFAFLTADFISVLNQAAKHAHQQGYHSTSFLHTSWGVALGYGVAFFIAALFVGRGQYRYRPALSVFVTYAVYLAIYLPTLDWNRGFSMEVVGLEIPLLTSPLGAALGRRLSAKAPKS
jgi:hypothetical protein